MNAGSEWFNYKHYHSLVLLAACSARYKLLFVDIGSYGRRSDGGIFGDSEMGLKLRNQRMNVPPPQAITQYNPFEFPYVVVADEAFPLENWMMRLYAKAALGPYERTYNYRLSRARGVIENVFGILVSRWRIFRAPICTYVETTEEIVKACACLHNWLLEADDAIENENHRYIPKGLIDADQDDGFSVDEAWRFEGLGAFADINRQGRNNYSQNADEIRRQFCQYFNNEGNIWWQHLYT